MNPKKSAHSLHIIVMHILFLKWKEKKMKNENRLASRTSCNEIWLQSPIHLLSLQKYSNSKPKRLTKSSTIYIPRRTTFFSTHFLPQPFCSISSLKFSLQWLPLSSPLFPSAPPTVWALFPPTTAPPVRFISLWVLCSPEKLHPSSAVLSPRAATAGIHFWIIGFLWSVGKFWIVVCIHGGSQNLKFLKSFKISKFLLFYFYFINFRSVAIIKSSKDTRYAIDSIVTHDGAKFPCWALPDLSLFRQNFGEEAYQKVIFFYRVELSQIFLGFPHFLFLFSYGKTIWKYVMGYLPKPNHISLTVGCDWHRWSSILWRSLRFLLQSCRWGWENSNRCRPWWRLSEVLFNFN